MTPNRSNRRVHSAEFKAQVLDECKQPVASVAAVATAHGLNPNVVRKWIRRVNLRRMGAEMQATAPRMPPLQFVSLELAKSELRPVHIPASQPDIRIELERGGLRLPQELAKPPKPSVTSGRCQACGAVEPGELAHVLAGAGLAVLEHHRFRRVGARGAVRPDVGLVRLAVAQVLGLEHRLRRLVGVQHHMVAQFFGQRLHQRLQLRAALTHPGGAAGVGQVTNASCR